MSAHEEFDVIVVGGGPGGATAATLVAMHGHRVLLLEKGRYPIYKIGESLLPSTIHGICALLGVREEVEQAGFVRKRGGTFRWGKSQTPWSFDFASSSRFQSATSYAFQVERLKFDRILIDNARRKGVDVREDHDVLEAHSEAGRVAGVDVKDATGTRRTMRARYVIDASGHESRLGRIVGERVYSRHFRNVAVYGYFHDAGRLPPPSEGNIFCAAFSAGWFWYIPLSARLTSVGAVVGVEHASRLKDGHESAFAEFISMCPRIEALLAGASRVTTGPYGQVRVRKDYSYAHSAFWTPGLALVGDAACFIDPVFSSGVHLATYAGLLAARSINTCLANAASEADSFGEFERRYRREFRLFYDFLVAFYDVEQDLDSYYWSARKVINSEEQGNEAFVRLVGGIGGSGEQLFSTGQEFVHAHAGLGDELFGRAAAGHAGAFADATPGPQGEQFLARLTEESEHLQAAGAGVRGPAPRLFEDGLVPSPDGLAWTPSRADASRRRLAALMAAQRGTA